jgi:UDP-glucose 4-epimerase
LQHKVLVTGGAGFIGSHLVERLLARGEAVTVLDDLSSGRPQNLPAGVRLVRGDILDGGLLGKLARDADSIFHLAALVSVPECNADWLGGHRINLGGSMAVLRAAQQAGNVPVIYASSAAVYGNRSGLACAEDSLPLPISPYAADKLATEHQARAMAEIHGLASVGLRFFNVYGPRQDAASAYAGVISKFCANRLADRPHQIFGDGGQSRDFIAVSDVAQGLLLARESLARRAGARVYNLCTGQQTTLLDLAAAIDHVSGRAALPIRHQPARGGDIRASCGAPDLAARELGFRAATGIEAGLATLWASLQGKGASG